MRLELTSNYRLCVFASGSLIIVVSNDLTLIKVSCLHLGQYKGKFINIVSLLIFILVLCLQIGHNNQYFPPYYHLLTIKFFS